MPPDIERVEAADEVHDPKTFEFTVETVWFDKFALKIGGQTKIRDGAKLLKSSGALQHPHHTNVRCEVQCKCSLGPEGWTLRVVLQTMNANITGSAIDIYRNVTIETDPRMGVVDLTILSLISQTHGSGLDESGLPASVNISGIPTAAAHLATATTPARATIGGAGITVEGLFRIVGGHVLARRVYIEGGRSGRGSAFYVQSGSSS